MYINIQIGNEPDITLERLKRIVSDLEVIVEKDTTPDEKVKRTLQNPTVMRRKIYVSDDPIKDSVSIGYRIEDYAVDDGKLILVGEANYTSKDLRA